ncbi:predicted protein [Phaeodactylum tricornutum CCAP 1055/1]|jgi:predicted RNA-binding protein with RPS1 domain|uniref:S1 motif domain-containing protein n=1 Tax=Phaeodactylum tricornutum (strain CCAP 1055/1) TaxID=556484 RepID=B7G7Q7_PHATC|nr:predicted protein [Phaeodactylum tricornutum CCAP 1055/1]EEC45275.1 predicted protein [Phaeodactylum tricornutum CCAP 1055/1]|eukprot:XP_002183057.1 predicted protein [Phaeodactylum tricornutum CCAP 1055/1]
MQTLPSEGSIVCGEIVRIEPYGAFVQLEECRARGLLHISQIANMRLEKVEDALSMNDRVWVKVLEVVPDDNPDMSRPQRFKIKLTMKNVAQDGTAQEIEASLQAGQRVSQAIEQNLNSKIGMGVARDPMAGYSNASDRLILKNDPSRKTTVINGYALVDDTEGVLPPESSLPPLIEPVQIVLMGRGRGKTLPAWMTNDDNGPIKRSEMVVNDDGSSSNESGRHSRKRSKRKSKEKRKKDRKRSRKTRYNDESERDDRDRDRHRKKRRRSQRSRSPSASAKSSIPDEGFFNRSLGDDRNISFRNVDEAKRLVEELEKKGVRKSRRS